MKEIIFKNKLICRLLAVATLVSSINMPAVFADGETTAIPENSLVMQIGFDGTNVVDKTEYETSVTVTKRMTNRSGDLVMGTLANNNNTPYMEMTGAGTVCIDVDSPVIKDIKDATFDVWVDNNYFGGLRFWRYLFGLVDNSSNTEKLFVDLNNGTATENLGWGINSSVPGTSATVKNRNNDSTVFDEWTHIVTTMDTSDNGATTSLLYYIDGKFVGGNSYNNIQNEDGTYTGLLSSENMRLRIGHADSAGTYDKDYGFVGKMGDFKVYNYAMTSSEILNAYNSEKANYIENLSVNFALETCGDPKVSKIEAVTYDSDAYVASPRALGGTIKATFTSPIHPDSITEESINLIDSEGNVVPGSVSVELSDMGYVAYITYGQLTDGASYSLKLDGLKNTNGVSLTDTSDAITFTGGTAVNGIHLVRPIDGKTVEYTLNYPLAAADFNPELVVEGAVGFDPYDAEYNEATRTITLTATDNFIEGNEYTVAYDGYTKTFTAEVAKEAEVIVPVVPEEVEPVIPTAPVEPEGSLMMNIGYNGTEVVDKTGNAKSVTKVYAQNVNGGVTSGTLANSNNTPYFELTGEGGFALEVDSDEIKNLGNMTMDIWLLNDQRTSAGVSPYIARWNDTLFAFANTAENAEYPLPFYVNLNDGTTYDSRGYGLYTVGQGDASNKFEMKYNTTDSSMYDEWVHLVITKEVNSSGSWATYKYYMNGERIGIDKISGFVQITDDEGNKTYKDPLIGDNNVLRIGNSNPLDTTYRYYGFTGKISEFKIFNYAKTAADINTQYLAQRVNYIEDLKDTFALDYVAASKQVLAEAAEPNPYANGGVIKAAFTAAVKEETINEETINLVDADGNVIPGSVSVELSDLGTIAYISYGQVAENSQYYLKINGLQSENGVPLFVISDALTFTGGTAANAIHIVRPFVDNVIEVTLNYPLAAADFDKDLLTLTAGGENIAYTDAAYDETTRTITITAKNNFVNRGQYTVEYDGLSKTFIAEEPVIIPDPVEPIRIGTPVFKDQDGNEIKSINITGVTSICSDIEVVTDGSTEFVAILSVYCGGQLVGTDMIGTNNSGCINKFTNEVTELDSKKTYSVKLDITALDETEEYSTKLMLWDTLGNMVPYTMFVPSDN